MGNLLLPDSILYTFLLILLTLTLSFISIIITVRKHCYLHIWFDPPSHPYWSGQRDVYPCYVVEKLRLREIKVILGCSASKWRHVDKLFENVIIIFVWSRERTWDKLWRFLFTLEWRSSVRYRCTSFLGKESLPPWKISQDGSSGTPPWILAPHFTSFLASIGLYQNYPPISYCLGLLFKPLVVLGSVGAVVGTWRHFSNSMTLEFC